MRSFWLTFVLLVSSCQISLSQVTLPSTPYVYINTQEIRSELVDLQKKAPGTGGLISLPVSEDKFHEFQVLAAPVLSRSLSQQYPEISSYRIRSKDDASITGRMSLSAKGIEAFLVQHGKFINIQPDKKEKGKYRILTESEDLSDLPGCTESIVDPDARTQSLEPLSELFDTQQAAIANGSLLRTYKLGIACTGEFTTLNGGATDAMNVLVNSVNALAAIYERELAVSFVLNVSHLYPDPATDPFIPDQAGGNSRTRQAIEVLGGLFSSGDYDIGHVFHRSSSGDNWSSGGVAYLRAVCNNNSRFGGVTKAGGWSGSSNNTTSGWYRLAAHEFGHMFGASHTFNGEGNSCSSGNISSGSSYEIGSGSTIMSYMGICQSNNNIPNVSTSLNTYFHHYSLLQMINHITSGGSCNNSAATNNTPPTVNVNPNNLSLVIPKQTPFILTADGTDADGDVLTYCWEQLDEDGSGAPTQGFIGNTAANSTTAPLFRSFPPTSESSRTFPEKFNILAGNNNGLSFEALPAVGRDVNFVLTVRDNNVAGNGLACGEITLNVDGNSGPFELTSQNSATTWQAGNTETISWSVNNTDQAPVNCSHVNILMSMDGGQTFPITLAANTPNDGTEDIVVPVYEASDARIMVQAAAGIFFDINNGDIQINSACKAQINCFQPSTAISLDEGDPGLDLNLTPTFGKTFRNIPIQITDSSPRANASGVRRGRDFSDCFRGFGMRYQIVEFSVKTAGIYTFSKSNGTFVGHSYFEGRIGNVNDPCSNTFLGSSIYDGDGVEGGSLFFANAVSMNLNPGQLYSVIVYAHSSQIPANLTIDATGPDDIILVEGQANDYAYTYIAVNNNNQLIAAVSQGADFTTLSDGNYTIWGLSYYTGNGGSPSAVDPSQYVGQALNSLVDGNNCALLSSNNLELEVIDNGLPDMALVAAKVFLGAAYMPPTSGGLGTMRTDLRNLPDFPTTTPYGAMYTEVNSTGESIPPLSNLLLIEDEKAIVDWIFLELRDSSDPSQVLATRSALLQADGCIVDTDGNSYVTMPIVPGNYYLAIRHRNHLGIMTETAHTFSASIPQAHLDFRDESTPTFSLGAPATAQGIPSGAPVGVHAMWGGNTNALAPNGTSEVLYSGTDNDVASISARVFGDASNTLGFPTFPVPGYFVEDLNMDGTTIFSGTGNDVFVISANIFQNLANSFGFVTVPVMEQLP